MLKIDIMFDDNFKKQINYTGKMSFVEWNETFFKVRYYCLNQTNERGNMTIDTYKVKYTELV